jgi:hypothetical protein
MAYLYEVIAIVRAWKDDEVVYDHELEILETRGKLGVMQYCLVKDIGGLIGRHVYVANSSA